MREGTGIWLVQDYSEGSFPWQVCAVPCLSFNFLGDWALDLVWQAQWVSRRKACRTTHNLPLILTCHTGACVKGILYPLGPSRNWRHKSDHQYFFTRICEWICLAEAITVIGQKKSQIMRKLNSPTFVLIFLFCLLAVHLCGSNKMVSSCFQLCLWSLLGSLMQNQISKQTRLCSFPSTCCSCASSRHLLSEKYSYFSKANLGLLNTESTFRGIRKGTEGWP